MRAFLAWVVALSLLVTAVAGGALLVSALVLAPAPLPSSLLAVGTSEGFYLANADGSDPRVVTSDGPYFVPRWSADGTMVATTAVIGDEGNMLPVFAADGSLVARIPGVTDLRWSPIAGELAISGFPEPRLQVVSPVPHAGGDAAEALSLALPTGTRRIVGFDWAPDGRKLAVGIVLGADPEAEPGLWLVPADGRPAEAVPGEAVRAASLPQWGPDGRRIAVTTPDRCDGARGCPSIVRILDAANGQRVAEVENLWDPAAVRWSPDGSMLAMDALMPGDPARRQREVFVYTLATNTIRRMSDTPDGRTWLLEWTPDGGSLLVSREVGTTGAREAWRLDVPSGAGRLLADDAHGVALQPAATAARAVRRRRAVYRCHDASPSLHGASPTVFGGRDQVAGVRSLREFANPDYQEPARLLDWLAVRSCARSRVRTATAKTTPYPFAMATEDTHGLGYQRVDEDPNVDVLIATMDATAGWDATQRLRSWERDRLRLAHGDRLLDVGCGLGEAALALAEDLGDRGEVVGIDASEQMLRVARTNARSARCRVRFTVGDACSLGEPDDSFEAVRSERTLQWLADPAAAVAEMVRVLRPGGRVSLIDTDWSTLRLDVGSRAIAALVRDAMRTERNRASNVGRRLHDLVGAAGCVPLGSTEATQTWTAWDPDESPAPPGCLSMDSLADDLIDRGRLATADRGEFVSTVHDAARRGAFVMTLTMFGVVAVAP